MPETIESVTLFVIVVALVVFAIWMLARTTDGVVRTDRKLDALLKHSGLDIAAIAAQEAQALVRAGKKVEAVKVYRQCRPRMKELLMEWHQRLADHVVPAQDHDAAFVEDLPDADLMFAVLEARRGHTELIGA
jgi:hypothetical protein